jgi:hypothetical protein
MTFLEPAGFKEVFFMGNPSQPAHCEISVDFLIIVKGHSQPAV